MKIKIYHNSRCRKSREALEHLNSRGIQPKIIEYLKNPLTSKQLEEVIQLLSIEPIQLVRINETIWKENYKGKEHSSSEIIEILSLNPKLIERPIIATERKAVIGRPIENLINFLESN